MKKNLMVVITFLLMSLSTQSGASNTNLSKQLDDIRIKSGVQGIAVGIVNGDAPAKFVSSGFADLEQRLPVTAKTQFRFGSVSKVLVALSMMKLVENNQLSLNDRLKSLAPEVVFHNPYAADHPLRVIHLLNHSTGWDGMRFAEKVPSSSPPISVKQALSLLPESRTSRWPPGSRSAYNNTGALVAAYLIEKLSGMPYETFVKQHFFEPIGMQHSDYFFTDDYRQQAATLYVDKKPVPYTHINNRAAGALNSSIEDMLKLIRFLNAQGSIDSHRLLAQASFAALQRPTGSLAAAAGLEITHLPGLQQFQANGVVFFGHEGSVRGGSALLVYQPDLKRGYVIAVNGEGPAIGPIHAFLSNMLSASNKPTTEQKNKPFQTAHIGLSGWYKNISPMSNITAPLQRLMPWKLNVSSDAAFIKPLLGGGPRQLHAGSNGQLLQVQTHKVVAVPLTDPIAGPVLHYGPNTFKRISTLSALLPILIGLLWLLFGLLAVLFGLWWLPRIWLKKMPFGSKEQLRLWPLATFLFAPLTLLLLQMAKSSPQLSSLFGQISWLSIGLMLTTSLFFILSLWGLYKWWQTSKLVIKGIAYWHATLLIGLNTLVSIYLLSYGMIGIRLWT